jgi:hypothetical protein
MDSSTLPEAAEVVSLAFPNMQPLPSSVNRSLGPQIAHRIKNLPIGTFIEKWTLGDYYVFYI